MDEVVLIPTWRRADFLLATLTRLRRSDLGDRPVRILIDRGPASDVVGVARDFAATDPATTVRIVEHGYRGNSFNVLTGYQRAIDDGFGLIHLVEEDVFVGVDYFRAHTAAHELAPDAFAVSLCRDHGLPVDQLPPVDETAAYARGHYQSIGVSLKAEQLRPVLEHAHAGYYLDMLDYCARTFPRTRIQAGHCEQDGLLNRVREQAGLSTVYAAVPRAYHAGFAGINRAGLALTGSIPNRAAQLLAMTADDLNARARQHRDHTTVDLDAHRQPLAKLISWP